MNRDVLTEAAEAAQHDRTVIERFVAWLDVKADGAQASHAELVRNGATSYREGVAGGRLSAFHEALAHLRGLMAGGGE
jgi:hypothetical protein